jgi:nitroreductase
MITGRSTGKQLWEAFQHRQPTRATGYTTPTVVGLRAYDRRVWLHGPIEDHLAQRRSVRVFAASAIPRTHVLGAIAAARDAEAAVWPRDTHSAITLDILIAAFGIDGLAKGLYATREANTELLSSDTACLDVLRKQYGDAPALLLMCADLNQACREAGPAGYPDTLIRAGTAGYAAWLWSISVGLAGCIHGSASQDANGIARRRDANLRHLFTVALGLSAHAVDPRAGISSEPTP